MNGLAAGLDLRSIGRHCGKTAGMFKLDVAALRGADGAWDLRSLEAGIGGGAIAV